MAPTRPRSLHRSPTRRFQLQQDRASACRAHDFCFDYSERPGLRSLRTARLLVLRHLQETLASTYDRTASASTHVSSLQLTPSPPSTFSDTRCYNPSNRRELMSRKTVRYIIAPILFVVSTSSLALSSEFIDASSAQESTQRTQSTASVPKSSPEMDKLAFLIGTWSAADIYEKSPINPNDGQGSGLYKTISGPGGFSLLTDYQYTGPHGESIGHQILTWDPKAAA